MYRRPAPHGAVVGEFGLVPGGQDAMDLRVHLERPIVERKVHLICAEGVRKARSELPDALEHELHEHEDEGREEGVLEGQRIPPKDEVEQQHQVHDVKILEGHRQFQNAHHSQLAVVAVVEALVQRVQHIETVVGLLSVETQQLRAPLQEQEIRHGVGSKSLAMLHQRRLLLFSDQAKFRELLPLRLGSGMVGDVSGTISHELEQMDQATRQEQLRDLPPQSLVRDVDTEDDGDINTNLEHLLRQVVKVVVAAENVAVVEDNEKRHQTAGRPGEAEWQV
mmetsp:Transcript_79675/g.221716  ORF Transcript_79675/g.221716 Transcript_79675/m.221716 type:complete len:279 (-) Transcript_79675:342-1178(-)|eukprot:CAMPEP_0117535238 /NCGR_PEP_ID=MMETSP0784-20121206/40831_1 /TAXON_ID=39447 /ORGANISM="" /LENGTH=278 /DNA_ID=CAMNT_0005331757 /DNA_START=182 /DNA_END=1018 /DNA_ORIENTATION=+